MLRWIIDTFINKIYLYDGDDARVEIYCNASDQGINVPLDKLDKGSSKGQLARLSEKYVNRTLRLSAHPVNILQHELFCAHPS